MSRIWSICAAIAVAATLSACSIPRPAARVGCDFPATPIRVSALESQPLLLTQAQGTTVVPGSFSDEMRTAIHRPPAPPAPSDRLRSTNTGPDQYLILSGGSQHGAFGAGFFYGMAQQGPLPTYKVVTGVSTGALQSTFLFLANQPTGGGSYDWVDGPMAETVKPGESNPGDLVLAYSIAKEGDILKPTGSGGLLAAVRNGSTDTFVPLRARLQAAITPQLLREIAEQYDAGRSLFVGVGDVDDGIGYAIDLTKLAHRVLDAGADVTMIQGCYIDALLASSSVPPGVPPVSLALHGADPAAPDMFVDGGTRDGVFVQEALSGMAGRSSGVKVTVIVNGVLYQGPWQEKGKRVEKWSAVTLALRSVDMLENQVYRFSVARAEDFGIAQGGLQLAFISTENLAAGAEQPDQHMFRGKTCGAWSDVDSAAGAQQFHPNYMSCLIDYGMARGKGQSGGAWNRAIDKPLTTRISRQPPGN